MLFFWVICASTGFFECLIIFDAFGLDIVVSIDMVDHSQSSFLHQLHIQTCWKHMLPWKSSGRGGL